MQNKLEFGDREIRLPNLSTAKHISCGCLEQNLVESGVYRIAAARDISPKLSEIDLSTCSFGTILLHEGKRRTINSPLPCVFTSSASGTLIEATSWKMPGNNHQFRSAEVVRNSWENALRLRREDPGVTLGFRNAQVGAMHAILAHWSTSEQPCTVVLPTGTGKTETMLGITIVEKAKLVLVIVPTRELRRQLSEKFKKLGILKSIDVLTPHALLPKVATLSSALRKPEDLEELLSCNVIVSTPMLLNGDPALLAGLAKKVSHVFFDEAHHLQASSWDVLKRAFSTSRIVQFTATPYRLDRKPINGKVIYQYSLEHAQKDGCFSEISLITVDERNPSKKDNVIADAAYARLLKDREEGFKNHCMMVRAGSKSRADILYKLYSSKFPLEKILLIYSSTGGKNKKINALKRGEYSIIVCVDMLKEGFDHPEFKIASVHDLHKSLAVTMQFIGRFTRDRSDLGKAHMVINFAEAEIPQELEKLYAEGSGWSQVISEVAQSKQEEAIEFIEFLSGCQPYKSFDDPDQAISPRLVNPALSCVVYRCTEGVHWERFHEAFPLKYKFSQPYENQKSNLFYFAAQVREHVKWTKSEAIRDQLWTLFLVHHAPDQGLLYIGCSDKKFKHNKLAEVVCLGDHTLICSNPVFRCFQNIKRLKIIHAGLLKPANRNHRYSKYSGADVTTQLNHIQSGGRSRKSDFVGAGYRDGKPVGVGASQKGKVWNPARVGNPKEWIDWCEMTGALLIDESIDSDQIFKDSAKVKEITQFPIEQHVIAIDWNEETFEKYHRMELIDASGGSTPLYLCEFTNWRLDNTKLYFEILREGKIPIAVVMELKGDDGHVISLPNNENILIRGWEREDEAIEIFFVDYPPTLFLADGSIISGCQHTEFHSLATTLPSDFFDPWDWQGVNIEIEAAYKSEKGKILFRENSVQYRVLNKCRDDGAVLVFNDDGSGESADVVAIFEDDDSLTLKLLHCKFSKGTKAGHRVDDLYEVCGQAVKSVKWKWDAKALLKHLQNRKNKGLEETLRFFHGDNVVLSRLIKKLEYAMIKFEFWIVQPGFSSVNIPENINCILMSSAATIADMTECRLRFISNCAKP